MNRYLRYFSILIVVAAMGLSTGCGKKTAETSSTAHEEEHGHSVPVIAANTSPEILAQIADQENQLTVAVETAHLHELHQLASNISDLVRVLDERVQGLGAAQATQLAQAADSVAAIATRLDHAGDSGNLGAAKQEFAVLRQVLDSIRHIQGLDTATLGASKTPPRAQNVTLAGEIVDPQCYFTHDSRGKEHADCAAMCARGGQGLAFLEEATRKVYPLIASGHGKSQNEGLLDHLGKQVRVTGVAYNKDGNMVLQIQSVASL
jgi:hypothetical protein